jgi:hypothetical protein
MSKIAATSASMVLAALLYHLRTRGWPYVDVEKLTDVYETYQSRSGTLLYGSAFNCSRSAIRQELDSDLAALEERQHVQRTVSRVQLTVLSLATVSQLEIHLYLMKLVDTADELFPLKVTP